MSASVPRPGLRHRLPAACGVLLGLTVSLLLSVPFLRAAEPRDEAIAIMQRANQAAPKDKEVLQAALLDIDSLIARSPSEAIAHYVRGSIQFHLQNTEASVAAYRRAIELDPIFTDARYELGVVLAEADRKEEALAEWEAALRADPSHIDAAYNAGQCNYDLGRFAEALEKWRITEKLTPDDFQVARKVLQALNALEREEEEAVARQKVLRIKREKRDEAVRDVPEFCFDQMMVGSMRIFAYESFGQSPAIPVYMFKVDRDREGTIGNLQLGNGPETGFTLRVSLPAGGKDHVRTFPTRPSWQELKPLVLAMAQERFGDGVK